jgi:hypothetical protein
MLLRLTKTQVRRLKSEVLKNLANNRCSSENLRINCLEELTRRDALTDGRIHGVAKIFAHLHETGPRVAPPSRIPARTPKFPTVVC